MPYPPPDRIHDILSMNRGGIIRCLEDTIGDCLDQATTQNGGKPDEIWMLYSFFMMGLPTLERRLNNLLGVFHIRVTISGILCHKNPQVHFTYSDMQGQPVPGRCELADIALLTTYGGRLPSDGLGNALLAQSKTDWSDVGSNKDQSALYRQVRQFQYYYSRLYGNGARELPEKARPALWHWIMTSHIHSHSSGAFQHPLNSAPLWNWMPMAEALFRLMIGGIGRGFSIPTTGDIGWNRIIFELIQITSQRATTCKNVYAQRLQGLRGEEAHNVIHEVLTARSGYAIKNSFGRIFAAWGDDLAKTGFQLEKPEEQWEPEVLLKEMDGGNHHPPPENEKGDGSDGMSFVIFDFEDLEDVGENVRDPLSPRKRRLDF